MQKERNRTTRGDGYGPIEIDRRTLTKLAGMAGVAVFATEAGSSVGAAEPNGTIQAMNIQPLYDRVLLQTVADDDNEQGGGPQSDEVTREGIVRATGDGPVGDDGEPIPLRVSEGDKVLFTDTGTEITIAGEEHSILSEENILAVIND